MIADDAQDRPGGSAGPVFRCAPPLLSRARPRRPGFEGDCIGRRAYFVQMNRHPRLVFVVLAALTVVACTSREVPTGVTTTVPSAATVIAAPAATAAATGTPPPQAAPASNSAAADWTVVRMEYVQVLQRYQLTVILDGKERTLDASRVCYEVAVPGQVLPETIPSPRGYDIDCHVGN